jgi:cell division septation protein DedD
MTLMLRDARKIRPRWELGLDGRRVMFLAALQLGLLAAAFAGGYLLARQPAPAVAAAPPPLAFRDPLAALDEEVPRVDLTFHRRLTEPRRNVGTSEPTLEPPVPPRSRREREARPVRQTLIEAQGLEDRARSIAARPRREEVSAIAPSSNGFPRATAAPAGTDEELREAMEAVVEPPRPVALRVRARPPEPKEAPPPKAAVVKPVEQAGSAAEDRGKQAPRGATTATAKAARYTLQVRAFPERDKAEEFVEHLRQRGLDAFVAEGDLPGRGRWFRVRIGQFSSKREAERYRQRFVAQQKTDAFVTLVR